MSGSPLTNMAIGVRIAGRQSRIFSPLSARIPCALSCLNNSAQLCYVNVTTVWPHGEASDVIDLSLWPFDAQQANKAVRHLVLMFKNLPPDDHPHANTHALEKVSATEWKVNNSDLLSTVIAQNFDCTHARGADGSQGGKTKCRLIGPAKGLVTFHGTQSTLTPDADPTGIPGANPPSPLPSPSGGNPIIIWANGVQTGTVDPIDGSAEVNLSRSTDWADFTPDDLCPPGSDMTCFAIFWPGITASDLPAFPFDFPAQFLLF